MGDLSRRSRLANLTEEIIMLKRNIYENFYRIGECLKLIRDEKLYEVEYKSFTEYCERQLDFTRRHAYNLIGIVEAFPREKAVLGLTRLVEIKKFPEKRRKEILEKTEKQGLSKRQIIEERKAQLVKPVSQPTGTGGANNIVKDSHGDRGGVSSFSDAPGTTTSSSPLPPHSSSDTPGPPRSPSLPVSTPPHHTTVLAPCGRCGKSLDIERLRKTLRGGYLYPCSCGNEIPAEDAIALKECPGCAAEIPLEKIVHTLMRLEDGVEYIIYSCSCGSQFEIPLVGRGPGSESESAPTPSSTTPGGPRPPTTSLPRAGDIRSFDIVIHCKNRVRYVGKNIRPGGFLYSLYGELRSWIEKGWVVKVED